MWGTWLRWGGWRVAVGVSPRWWGREGLGSQPVSGPGPRRGRPAAAPGGPGDLGHRGKERILRRGYAFLGNDVCYVNPRGVRALCERTKRRILQATPRYCTGKIDPLGMGITRQRSGNKSSLSDAK